MNRISRVIAVCYRQRVREQIARDRAEHKIRQQEQKAASSPAQHNPPTANTPATKKEYTTCKLQVFYSGKRLAVVGMPSEYVHLFYCCFGQIISFIMQIRLLGGGAIVHEFSASSKLDEVQRFVESQATSPQGNCMLMTSFPKHVFTREEADKTLQELGQ